MHIKAVKMIQSSASPALHFRALVLLETYDSIVPKATILPQLTDSLAFS